MKRPDETTRSMGSIDRSVSDRRRAPTGRLGARAAHARAGERDGSAALVMAKVRRGRWDGGTTVDDGVGDGERGRARETMDAGETTVARDKSDGTMEGGARVRETDDDVM